MMHGSASHTLDSIQIHPKDLASVLRQAGGRQPVPRLLRGLPRRRIGRTGEQSDAGSHQRSSKIAVNDD
jgi:hypothetical protein